jgi:CDP-diacylglycerol---serine O-phosphatidyltransferase
MGLRSAIPNALTCGNLLCGMGGIYAALVWGDLYAAGWYMLAAALLDVLDGAVARMLKASSVLGADLDSLADVVSFGVLPSFICIQIFITNNGIWYLQALPAVLAVAAAVRLARFNNDPGQTYWFNGLPSPAAGLATVGIAFQSTNADPLVRPELLSPSLILAVAFTLAILMVVPIKLISFKMGFGTLWPYWVAILVLGGSAVLIVEGLVTLTVVLSYVVVSQFYFLRNSGNKPAEKT